MRKLKNYDFEEVNNDIVLNSKYYLYKDLKEEELFDFVDLDETESEHLKSEPYSYWKFVFRVFIKKPSAIIGLLTLLIIFIGIIIVSNIYDSNLLEMNITNKNISPNSIFLWGTDLVGRDIFTMVWLGAKKSIILALCSSILVIAIGTIVGLIWGYFRKLDPIFIELYNLISNIPSLLIYMLLSYVFMQAFPQMSAEVRLVISLSITGWVGFARFIRNQTLIINNREFNIASKTLGTQARRIMVRNLLPYLLGVIITETSLIIPGMIASEVAMSYFGVGLPSTAISLGVLLDNGRKNFELYPFQLLYPTFFLAFIIFAFFLIGLALTDALDPKKHR